MGALEQARAAVAGANTCADGGTANGVTVADLAHAEAMLAVAEEQRTGNLLAYLASGQTLASELRPLVLQIRERLGIGGEFRG
ncbi:hypothetical protein [Actinotalea sp. Marseille-Q4924]|uniref:hypothetical protein n=1 Tax=Actinotalea sp. Marseille-Q4924 TaxID=2866571 RepID=UPI001CE487D7|nr:hypothetical protein [Actinotalea sp. Marseille-Q4924]